MNNSIMLMDVFDTIIAQDTCTEIKKDSGQLQFTRIQKTHVSLHEDFDC